MELLFVNHIVESIACRCIATARGRRVLEFTHSTQKWNVVLQVSWTCDHTACTIISRGTFHTVIE